MSLALFGVSTLLLQHKEHVVSLLGLGTHDFAYNLGFACSRSLSAAAVLLLQGHLLFKWTNPLLRRQLDTTGLNLLKLVLVWVAISMAVYRCQQECVPSTFLSMEQHLYRVQWYLRLFAASAVLYGTVLATLQGSKSRAAAQEATPLSSTAPNSGASSTPASCSAADSAAGTAPASGSAAIGTAGGAPEGVHAGRTQSVNRPQVKALWPDAVCEAVCLPERMTSIFGDWGHGLLRFAVSPMVFVLLCAWLLPQHPAFRWSTYQGVLGI